MKKPTVIPIQPWATFDKKKEAEMFPGVFGVPEMKLSLQWKYLNENKTLVIFPALSSLSTELRAAGDVEDFEKIVVTK